MDKVVAKNERNSAKTDTALAEDREKSAKNENYILENNKVSGDILANKEAKRLTSVHKEKENVAGSTLSKEVRIFDNLTTSREDVRTLD